MARWMVMTRRVCDQGEMMIPGRNLSPAMIGRNGVGGVAYASSSSALSLGQSLLDGHHHQLPSVLQQHHHNGQHLMDQHQHQLPPQATTTSESDARNPRDELEMSKSGGSDNLESGGGGGGSGEDQDPNQRPRKKRYHRHTQHQIQELESFFKECPHPDDKQRKELSRELGLEPLQVKFWFQNKRTQMKTQHERHENNALRAENDKLRAENMRYKEALANASCPNCGGPAAIGEMSFDEHHLRLENARLRDEIDRISAIAAKYVGKPAVAVSAAYPPLPPPPPSNHHLGMPTADVFSADFDKSLVIELAVAAMEELVRMAQLGDPLWVPAIGGEALNEDEYARAFPRGLGPKSPDLLSESSRESAVVIMNHVSLVEMLMDVSQWNSLFSNIVSRSATLQVLSTGVAGNHNGALQLMSAEFQMPSPLVPTRETHFLRYCKQHPDGTWAVVDVSLDNLRSATGIAAVPAARHRRRPSGCLIHEMPNGYSKVTWVEHVEADDSMVHDLYKPVVNSGVAFGARRWVATLERQCERLASAMATAANVVGGDIGGVITTAEGRRSMMKLAERMVASFCGGVTASTTHQWTTLSGSGAEDVRVMTRKSVDDPGRPPGIILNAATSFWLPVPPSRVFDFLRDDTTRSEWDILSNGGVVQEMAHIANGRDHGNAVSLLRVNECCTDATGSYVIYAPVDVVAMNVVLNGGDPDYVALLPSGFAILPDGPDAGGGSLLTVAFQILVDSVPTAKLSLGSVATVNSLIACTVERIKAAIAGGADNASALAPPCPR
uniref:Homeobox domain-containing protein n=1 Tax=Leersia perrieri TaxID=77586 RepID=A0A0D9X461_9ORYZ